MRSRDISLSTAASTRSELHDKQVRKSGLFGGGGLNVTWGSQNSTNTAELTQLQHTGTVLGSTDGNVAIVAGNQYRQVGSDVLALKGDIDMQARDITITEARDTTVSEQGQTFKKSGLTLALSSSFDQAKGNGLISSDGLRVYRFPACGMQDTGEHLIVEALIA